MSSGRHIVFCPGIGFIHENATVGYTHTQSRGWCVGWRFSYFSDPILDQNGKIIYTRYIRFPFDGYSYKSKGSTTSPMKTSSTKRIGARIGFTIKPWGTYKPYRYRLGVGQNSEPLNPLGN